MIGGPRGYGAGGYTDTPLEETLPVDMGVRDRQKQPDVALVVVIDKSGSMDACHCNTFDGGMGGGGRDRRRQEGRHRQGGDPARGLGADRAGRAGRRRLRRGGPLGRQDRAAGRHRGPPGRDRRDHSRTARPTSSPASTRRCSRSRDGHGDAAPHHPAHRRLVQQRPVRRDPGQDEGRRDHALDGRRGRRRQPVPRAARAGTAADGSTPRRTRPRSRTSSSRRRSRSPASRSSRSRSSRS